MPSKPKAPPITNEASESRPAKVPGNQTGRRISRLRDERSRNDAIARILQSADRATSRCNFGARSALSSTNTSISSSSETPRGPVVLPSRTHTNMSVFNRVTHSDPSICTSTTSSSSSIITSLTPSLPANFTVITPLNTSITASQTPSTPAIFVSTTPLNFTNLTTTIPSNPSSITSTNPPNVSMSGGTEARRNPPRTAGPQPPPSTVEDDPELHSDSPSISIEPLPTSPAPAPPTGSPQPPDSPTHPAVQDTPSGGDQIDQTPWEASREVRPRSRWYQRTTNQLRYSKYFGLTTVPNLLTCDHQIKRQGRNKRSQCTVSCVDKIVEVNTSVTVDMEAGKLRAGRKRLAYQLYNLQSRPYQL
ncbi:hypothetical protein FPQ18DRAFT_309150 [Pyronema domesticum]|nr:hypothetical protein FPQ18DRAFT_309150 [Pyronema domesticum]